MNRDWLLHLINCFIYNGRVIVSQRARDGQILSRTSFKTKGSHLRYKTVDKAKYCFHYYHFFINLKNASKQDTFIVKWAESFRITEFAVTRYWHNCSLLYLSNGKFLYVLYLKFCFAFYSMIKLFEAVQHFLVQCGKHIYHFNTHLSKLWT